MLALADSASTTSEHENAKPLGSGFSHSASCKLDVDAVLSDLRKRVAGMTQREREAAFDVYGTNGAAASTGGRSMVFAWLGAAQLVISQVKLTEPCVASCWPPRHD